MSNKYRYYISTARTNQIAQQFVIRHDSDIDNYSDYRSYQKIIQSGDINHTTSTNMYDTAQIARYVTNKAWEEISKEEANEIIRNWIKHIEKEKENQ